MWLCPNCKEEIDNLSYNVNTNSSEYGNAYISKGPPTEENPIEITDHECSDNGDTDWNDNPEYSCPECSDEVNLKDLIWQNDEEAEKEEQLRKEKEPEETLHNIIKPNKNILKNETSKDISESTIICKKCLHLFIHGIEDCSYQEPKEEFAECPKCGTINSFKEFKELLEKGVFNLKIKNAH